MDQFYFRNLPITTGAPRFDTPTAPKPKTTEQPAVSFREVLQEQTQQLTFSKHAAQRIAQRGIELTESSMARLNEGVRLAEEKGLGDTLILVDNTAFLVNVRGNRIITTVSNDELRGNVFTNIDGTVVI